jgi:hypothetical protein
MQSGEGRAVIAALICINPSFELELPISEGLSSVSLTLKAVFAKYLEGLEIV